MQAEVCKFNPRALHKEMSWLLEEEADAGTGTIRMWLQWSTSRTRFVARPGGKEQQWYLDQTQYGL